MKNIKANNTLEEVIQNINKVGVALKNWYKGAEDQVKINFSKFDIRAYIDEWQYEVEIPENLPGLKPLPRQKFGHLKIWADTLSGLVIRGKVPKFLFSELEFEDYQEILFKDLPARNAKILSKQLAEVFLKNDFNLPLETFQELYNKQSKKRPKTIREPRQLKSLEQYTPGQLKSRMKAALKKWLALPGRMDAGKQLDNLRKYMPPEVWAYNGEFLYRGVMVSTIALNKCLKKDKPLIYHSREYSSWTPAFETAEEFGLDEFDHSGYRGVIFSKKFKPSQILVDIPALREFLGLEEGHIYEIIVKLSAKDLKFTKHDIYQYENKNGDWIFP